MIVEMGPEWLTQVLPGGLRATWGGFGSAVDFDGKAM